MERARCAISLLDYHVDAQMALQGRVLHIVGPYWKWRKGTVTPKSLMDRAINVEDDCGVDLPTDVLESVLTWDYEDDPLRMISFVIDKVRCVAEGDPCEGLDKRIGERKGLKPRGGPEFD